MNLSKNDLLSISKWVNIFVIFFSLAANAIIGGEIVEKKTLESKHAALITSSDEFFTPCTAVFISPSALLTAAHCVKEKLNLYLVVDARNKLRPNDFMALRPIIIDRDQMTVHPSYDLALIKLKRSIESSQPVPILKNDLNNNSEEKLSFELLALGYGQGVVFSDTPSYVLRKVLVTDLQNLDAQRFQVNHNGVRGICKGDSGGPGLITKDGKYVLLGIAIATLSIKDQPACTWSGEYLKISPFIEWIQEKVPDIQVVN